jgi:N-acetylneuraminate lyase
LCLRAVLEDNMAYGVHGFWVAGTSGEGPLLSDAQRDTVARIAGETTQGRALSIMHVGAITFRSFFSAMGSDRTDVHYR